ncbi:nuclear transport factor 2 family protein [Dyella silvae]|uniref:nuclear transport factor 2 family protein n=1 Tax=Dyella silvae TaxID=2994424 RepID=UPI002264BDA0|nr:nuclear transport factor 2 family protein [Dyella silvae]
MPDRRVVSDFVALVESGEYVEAIQRFYHPEAVVWENQRQSRVGLDALIENEQRVLSAFTTVTGRAASVIVEGDDVVISWQFDFFRGGAHVLLEEVAMQQWVGGKIMHERFYYDPSQMQPASGQAIDQGSTQKVAVP